jgi:gamma-glutamylaminecyclotransferase
VSLVVFVYGTLKRGFANHDVLSRARPLGRARTREAYPLAVAGPQFLPILLRRPGEGRRVFGEIYEIDGLTLEALDELEGVDHADGYRRETIPVVGEPGGAVRDAIVYFKKEPAAGFHTPWLEDYQDRRYRAHGFP